MKISRSLIAASCMIAANVFCKRDLENLGRNALREDEGLRDSKLFNPFYADPLSRRRELEDEAAMASARRGYGAGYPPMGLGRYGL